MSRKIAYQDNRLTVATGIDHALGKFVQVFDKEMEDETPEGEGLVFDWSELFGFETNVTGYPDSMGVDSIVDNYIKEHYDCTDTNSNENNMIKYVIGDATNPQGEGTKIIIHVCNDIGAWGAGFVLALSRKWKEPEREYRKLKPEERQLGNVQLVCVEPNIYVANMIGQHGISDTIEKGVLDKNITVPPIRYDALKKCMGQVRNDAHLLNASVHMPRIGCGLAGGKWEKIEPIIIECLIDAGIEVTVYDLPERR